jgi:hypothetical protein
VQPLRDRSRRILIISRPELVDISRNFGLVALRKVLPVERRLVQFARGNLNFFPPLDHHTLPAGDFHMRPICLLHLSPLPWIHSCKHSANHGETPVTFTSLIPRSVARLSRPNMNCSISSGAGRRMVQSQWDRNFALALPHSTMSFCSNDLLFSLSACSLRISTKYSKRARCRFVAQSKFASKTTWMCILLVLRRTGRRRLSPNGPKIYLDRRDEMWWALLLTMNSKVLEPYNTAEQPSDRVGGLG